MNLLKKLVLVTLLALWVPVTSHCLLAALSGLESLTCCASVDRASDASHNESDCETDSCATIESGLYKSDVHHVSVPLPRLTVALFDCSTDEQTPPNAPMRAETFGLPPDLTPSLHFRLRSAPSPRAPSIV